VATTLPVILAGNQACNKFSSSKKHKSILNQRCKIKIPDRYVPPDYESSNDVGTVAVCIPVHEMTHYLIDIRLMGPVRQQIDTLSRQLEEKFRLKNKLVVPHISLAGPFSTENEQKLISDFTGICTGQTEIPKYAVGNYGFFNDTRVVFVTIIPDESLRQFRYRLSRTISPYCSLRKYDLDSADDFQFHATLAMKLDWLTFQRIRWYFKNQEPVIYRHHPIRATLLKNSQILCEYDFSQNRMLSRSQARSRATMKRDFDRLKVWDDESRESD